MGTSTPSGGSARGGGCAAVVAGDATVGAMLSQELRQAGLSVRAVKCPDELAEELWEWPVDVVVLGVGEKESRAEAVLEQMATRAPGTPVVLVAGVEQIDWAARCVRAGVAAGAVQRPWWTKALLECVHKALGGPARAETAASRDDASVLREGLERALGGPVAPDEAQVAHVLLPMFRGLASMSAVVRGAHERRVSSVLWQFARHLGLGETAQRHLALLGLVHDIGELELPEDVRALPEYQLSGRSKASFREHPERGERFLSRVPGLVQVARSVRAHHEHYDGSGFPDALSGEAIPWPARVLGVIDRYDEAVNCGLFPTRLTPREALRFLKEESGRLFDARVVRCFAHWRSAHEAKQPEVEQHRAVELNRLRPGMRLAEDLKSADGVLLVPAGQRITEHLVERLARLDKQAQVGLSAWVWQE